MKLGTKKKVVGKIRRSQLITMFGTGSIVDMPEYSVIMATTDFWNDCDIIYEQNLQKLLGKKYFMEPKASETDDMVGSPDIPAFRFPKTHFCPKCKRLMSYKYFGDPNGKKCPQCNKELVPSRFMAACINGHLEDFPYQWWVHNGNYSDCPAAGRYDNLVIDFSSSSGGLGSIKIKCTACGKERTMEGCMNKDALKGYHCRGMRPWIGTKKDSYDPQPCHAVMRTLQRGASNVHFSITQSALTIPPWSKAIHAEIDKNWSAIKNILDKSPDEKILDVLLEALYKDFLDNGRFSLKDLKQEIYRRIDDSRTENFDVFSMYEDEYKALCTEYDDEAEDRFKTVESEVPDKFKDYFDSVMLVKRLREVMVLKGFRRITPECPGENSSLGQETDGREYVPLGKESTEWLPGIELLGEGIFIKFNEERIQNWENKMAGRYNLMLERLGDSNLDNHKFSPRYVLLHTFSHLLIRQLSENCGYAEASLKERIYSTYKGSETKMAGILIYTSSPDSDGSLGGLVRQGETDNLSERILNLLQEASWCSSDPLCSESMSQGYNSLNYAACHACTLLPETCCEARNCFLDRVAVIGSMENRDWGYFGEFFEE